MIWQDVVFAVGNGLFVVALIPAVLYGPKPPRSTCWLTGVTLVAFTICFFSLDLRWGGLTTMLCAVCWLDMAVYRER